MKKDATQTTTPAYDALVQQAIDGDQDATVQVAAINEVAKKHYDADKDTVAVRASIREKGENAVLGAYREQIASRPGLLAQVTNTYRRIKGIEEPKEQSSSQSR